MTVTVNGQQHDLAVPATVADVVAGFAQAPTGVAVACNGEIVPRSAWSTTPIRSGDRVEILTAVAGG